MTEPVDALYPWLPLASCLTWLEVSPGGTKASDVEQARQAAASWIEEERSDLFGPSLGDPEVPEFHWSPRIVQAGLLVTARFYARKGTPAGLVNYGDFAGAVLRNDPDIELLLYDHKPAVG